MTWLQTKYIGHREVSRQEEEYIDNNNKTANNIPEWDSMDNKTNTIRQRHDNMDNYVVNYKDIFISDNRMLELSCVCRNLQI